MAIKTKFSAVIGAIRPVGTAPKCSGLRTTPGVDAEIETPKELDQLRARHRENERGKGTGHPAQPWPVQVRDESNTDQRAVLGAIGIYLARTLASSSRPEIQPMNVSKPSAIVSDAQINGTMRKRRFSLRSSVTP
jgi:hypothetical protein